ncbi:hypothetical protein N7541_006317 [Penicillium brevicompactum]|uniref:Uncharacterized protein n=1 Tax=Penicillium brevicompactum TaxID=5074 RepID=A0A9W9UQF8_PENBR|nr:hypothetical protein N7541_006317 [Penicillium brevicompactum]
MPEDRIRDPVDYTNSTSDMIRQELASHHNLSSHQFMHTQHEKGADDANAMPPSDLPPEMLYSLLGGTS